jgi:hypothetical protein
MQFARLPLRAPLAAFSRALATAPVLAVTARRRFEPENRTVAPTALEVRLGRCFSAGKQFI